MPKNHLISHAAELSGLTVDTLRHYERLGLLKPGRTAGGRRVYEGRDLMLLRFVARMRATDMPLGEIRRYLDLAALGDSTAGERKAQLEIHAGLLNKRIKAAEAALETIQFKLDHFDAIQRGDQPEGTGCSGTRPGRRPPDRRAVGASL